MATTKKQAAPQEKPQEQEFNLRFTAAEVQYTLNALGRMPYIEVADFLVKIQQQVQAQQVVAENK